MGRPEIGSVFCLPDSGSSKALRQGYDNDELAQQQDGRGMTLHEFALYNINPAVRSVNKGGDPEETSAGMNYVFI
jgi:hypothetical protein